MRVRRSALPRHPVARAAALFFTSYLTALILWIAIMDRYAHAVVFVASKTAAGVKGVRVDRISLDGRRITTVFTLAITKDKAEADVEIPLSPSSFTFNSPLTFAILASLSVFITRNLRAYGEAALILVAVHFLYVFSHCTDQLTGILIDMGIETASPPRRFFYQFLWGFTDNMLIRFEPFLLGLYVFMRFRREG